MTTTRARYGTAIVTALCALALAGCGPHADDAPVVIVGRPGGEVDILVPVCAGDGVRLVKAYQDGQQVVRWTVDGAEEAEASSDRIEVISASPSGLELDGQFPHVTRAGGDRLDESVTVPFWELGALDIWTGETEAYIHVEWLDDGVTPQFYFASMPFGEDNVETEAVSESEGRERLLEFCQKRRS